METTQSAMGSGKAVESDSDVASDSKRAWFALNAWDRLLLVFLIHYATLGFFLANLEFTESSALAYSPIQFPFFASGIAIAISLFFSNLKFKAWTVSWAATIGVLAFSVFLVYLEGHWTVGAGNQRLRSADIQDSMSVFRNPTILLIVFSALIFILFDFRRRREFKFGGKAYAIAVFFLFALHTVLTQLDERMPQPCLSGEIWGTNVVASLAILVMIIGGFVGRRAQLLRTKFIFVATTFAAIVLLFQHADVFQDSVWNVIFVLVGAMTYCVTLLVFPIMNHAPNRPSFFGGGFLILFLVSACLYLTHDLRIIRKDLGDIAFARKVRELEWESSVYCRVTNIWDSLGIDYFPEPNQHQVIDLKPIQDSMITGVYIHYANLGTELSGLTDQTLVVSGKVNWSTFFSFFDSPFDVYHEFRRLDISGELPTKGFENNDATRAVGFYIEELQEGEFRIIADYFSDCSLTIKLGRWSPNEDDLVAFHRCNPNQSKFTIYSLDLGQAALDYLSRVESPPIRCFNLEVSGTNPRLNFIRAILQRQVVLVNWSFPHFLTAEDISKLFLTTELDYWAGVPFAVQLSLAELELPIAGRLRRVRWVLNGDQQGNEVASIFLPLGQPWVGWPDFQKVSRLEVIVADWPIHRPNLNFELNEFVPKGWDFPKLRCLALNSDVELDCFRRLPNLTLLRLRWFEGVDEIADQLPRLETLAIQRIAKSTDSLGRQLEKMPQLSKLIAVETAEAWWRWFDIFSIEEVVFRTKYKIPWNIQLEFVSQKEFEVLIPDLFEHQTRLRKEFDNELNVGD